MFTEKTVFVLGAGSSMELGLPSGRDLADQIALDTQFYFEGFNTLIKGDATLVSFCHNRNKDIGGGYFQKVTTAGWLINEGLPLAASIDNFIATHIDNREVVELGKAAIVNRILQAEYSSKLFIDRDKRQAKWKEAAISATWLTSFFHKLVEGVKKEELANIFDNVFVINFNYDRCLEHFLTHALARYFNQTLTDTFAIVRKLWVKRPYGKIANYTLDGHGGVLFGSAVNEYVIAKCFDNIKTFSEDEPDIGTITDFIFK